MCIQALQKHMDLVQTYAVNLKLKTVWLSPQEYSIESTHPSLRNAGSSAAQLCSYRCK